LPAPELAMVAAGTAARLLGIAVPRSGNVSTPREAIGAN